MICRGTSYGTEAEARMVYKTRNNYCVIETGLIISQQYPWLACSPDGSVLKNGKPHKLVEIKCPIIGKYYSKKLYEMHKHVK